MRDRLPNRRPHTLHRFAHNGQQFEAGVGYTINDGRPRPREVFLDFALVPGSSVREGSDTHILCDDIATLISIALQYGAPLETLAGAVGRAPIPLVNGKPAADHAEPMSLVGRTLDLLLLIDQRIGRGENVLTPHDFAR